MRSQAELDQPQIWDLFARVPAAVAVFSGPDHHLRFANPAFLRISGRSSLDAILGRPVAEALSENKAAPYLDALHEVYRTGSGLTTAKTPVTHNSDAGPLVGHFDFVYEPIRNAAGEVDGVFLHAVEVSDQAVAGRAVQEMFQRVRLAEGAAQIGIWEWDAEQDQRILSPELHEIFGTNAADPHHPNLWASRVHPEDFAAVQQQMLAGYHAGAMDFEYRYLHPQRGTRWFLCKGRRETGQARMYGVVLDITDRKNAEEATARLAAIVESSDDAIVAKDLNGVITSWNTGAQRIFEYSPEEAVGQHITLIIPPEHQAEETEILRRLRLGQRIDHFETVRVTKSGRLVDVSLTVSPVKDSRGRVIGASKIARDITQRKQAEKALREAHEQLEERVRERTAELELAQEALRTLSGRLLQAQDEERRRIARELHDSAGQLVAALNMNLVPLQAEAGKLGKQFSAAVEESLDLVEQLSKELRTISHLLHPPMLDEAGLEFALQWFVEGFAQRSKIEVDFELAPELGRLSRELETTIFRIVQEALTNIHRHSHSRTASVRLTSGAEQVCVQIQDHGRGMPTGAARAKPGVGIQGMRERVRRLGGRLDIRSSSEQGTTVTAILPLTNALTAGSQ